MAQAALAQGLVDTLELFIIRVTLGDGVRLFGWGGVPRGWQPDVARPFPNGVAGLGYRRGRGRRVGLISPRAAG